MTRIRHVLLVCALTTVFACGDDGKKGDDAGTDGNTNLTCAVTSGEIASYPGTVSGTVLGGGADATVADMACASQPGRWYDPKGEDVVVHLTGLTVGSNYVVQMTTDDDLSFYVTTACPPPTGAVTDCALFVDDSYTNEQGLFTATTTEAWVVVDTAADPAPPTTGMFKLDVQVAECTADTEATDCAAPTPRCDDAFKCVGCLSAFDCAMATPACVAETCVASPAQCTGDDARDNGAGDDGPTVATTIAMPGVGTPTTVTGAVCDLPSGEADWFKIHLTDNVGIELTFTGAANDLDVVLLDSTGAEVAVSQNNAGIPEGIATSTISPAITLPGDYYIVVLQYEQTPANAAAVSYTLKVSREDCTNSFDCPINKPACSAAGVCGGGSNGCVGDDAADTAGTDDGPLVGRSLDGAVGTGIQLTGNICSAPSTEADFYQVTAANGEGVTIALAWTDNTIELDTVVFDKDGRVFGESFYGDPETIKLTYLPTGTYYISVIEYADGFFTPFTSATTPYTITATKTVAQQCATPTDCAAEYQTQIYRGTCVGGTKVCNFDTTTAGVEGTACDSGDNCASGSCSYIPFESDAQKSVCTKTCATTTDCASLANFTCLASQDVNTICIPKCTSDLECGVNVNSTTADPGLPWDYNACDVATGTCTF